MATACCWIYEGSCCTSRSCGLHRHGVEIDLCVTVQDRVPQTCPTQQRCRRASTVVGSKPVRSLVESTLYTVPSVRCKPRVYGSNLLLPIKKLFFFSHHSLPLLAMREKQDHIVHGKELGGFILFLWTQAIDSRSILYIATILTGDIKSLYRTGVGSIHGRCPGRVTASGGQHI